MALLATQDIVNAGTAPTFAAVAASDTADVGNGRNVFAVYKNTNAATRTITITVPGTTPYGQNWTTPVLTIAANTGELWIPLRLEYRDPVTGLATLTPSVITNVTVAIVRMS